MIPGSPVRYRSAKSMSHVAATASRGSVTTHLGPLSPKMHVRRGHVAPRQMPAPTHAYFRPVAAGKLGGGAHRSTDQPELPKNRSSCIEKNNLLHEKPQIDGRKFGRTKGQRKIIKNNHRGGGGGGYLFKKGPSRKFKLDLSGCDARTGTKFTSTAVPS
eukprot:SAG31_NODE_1637_length_7679_cov_5.133509_4_plen_159_part_00